MSEADTGEKPMDLEKGKSSSSTDRAARVAEASAAPFDDVHAVPPDCFCHGEGRKDSDISKDCVACPTEDDPASAVASRRARALIFLLLCQVVQAFMSYDGGATPASLDTIQKDMDNAWSPGEFGLLGAMDKIGMTATSIFWGRLLQLCNTKLLLGVGLFMNAAWTAMFGMLQSKVPMFVAKFAMGATQSLQGVWATVWTVTMAPPDCKTVWLGLGGVSAGVGNGIGTAVAGFSTANGLPYSFAFQLQAAILGVLWLVLLLSPPRWLATQLPSQLVHLPAAAARPEGGLPQGKEQRQSSDTSLSTGAPQKAPGVRKQTADAFKNGVYCWTALAISNSMFVMSGVQFLWIRVFVEVWGLNKNFVTLMFLLVTGIGGGLGIAFGPAFVDKRGGFHRAPGVLTSLQLVRNFSIVAAIAGVSAIACLYGKLRSFDEGYLREWGDHWLWLLFTAIFFIWAAHNAMVPALCGINMEVVPPEMRTFASGMEMTMRNILGYAFGPLLPGLIMNAVASMFSLKAQLCLGLGFVFAANVAAVWVMCRAVGAARTALSEKQTAALQRLRQALRDEDVAQLTLEVIAAKTVDLHRRQDGEAVIGMANEAIGAHHAIGRAAFSGATAFTATRAELQRSLAGLEREVARLRSENSDLRNRLSNAEAPADDGPLSPAARRRSPTNSSSLDIEGTPSKKKTTHFSL